MYRSNANQSRSLYYWWQQKLHAFISTPHLILPVLPYLLFDFRLFNIPKRLIECWSWEHNQWPIVFCEFLIDYTECCCVRVQINSCELIHCWNMKFVQVKCCKFYFLVELIKFIRYYDVFCLSFFAYQLDILYGRTV